MTQLMAVRVLHSADVCDLIPRVPVTGRDMTDLILPRVS